MPDCGDFLRVAVRQAHEDRRNGTGLWRSGESGLVLSGGSRFTALIRAPVIVHASLRWGVTGALRAEDKR